MKRSSSLLSILIVATATGCAMDTADATEDTEGATGELDGPIFPEDELPQYSCGRGVQLTCPSMISFNVSAPQSFVSGNGSRANRAVSETAVASISADGSTIQCQPASAFQVTGIPGNGVFLPAGVEAIPNAANTSFSFHAESDGRSIAVPVTRQSPIPASAPPGAVSCGFHCDGEGVLSTVCRNGPNPGFDDAQITISGRTTTVDTNGTIESLETNDLNGLTSHTCKLTIPANRIATQVNTRPRDILGVSRGRFVRGFELTGTALRNACTDIANRTCGGSSSCVTASVNECVAEFQGDDPCDGPLPR
jgi:hypothetical protein